MNERLLQLDKRIYVDISEIVYVDYMGTSLWITLKGGAIHSIKESPENDLQKAFEKIIDDITSRSGIEEIKWMV